MIEPAVQRVSAAYRSAGSPAVARASRSVERTLLIIQEEVAPLRLPEDVVTFWRLADPHSLQLGPYPHLTSAEFALHSWRRHEAGQRGTPRCLFPIAYESHGFLLVDIDPSGPSHGWLYYYAYGGSDFRLRHVGLAEYLDLLATMIELDEYQVHHRDGRTWVQFDPEERWEDAALVRLSQSLGEQALDAMWDISEDPREWPPHWLASSGLSTTDRSPRGQDVTIAELLGTAGIAGRASGTIHARVVSLAGGADGVRVTVHDASGELDLWCPASVCTYGPVMRRSFEFDVVIRGAPYPPPDTSSRHAEVQRRALAGDIEGAAETVGEIYQQIFGESAAAEATAVRPLDGT